MIAASSIVIDSKELKLTNLYTAKSKKVALVIFHWTYGTMQWFTWVITKQELSNAQFPMPNATFIESAVYGDVLYGMTRMLMSKNVTTMTSARIRIRSKPLSTRIRIYFQKRENLSRELLGVGEKLPSAPRRDFHFHVFHFTNFCCRFWKHFFTCG